VHVVGGVGLERLGEVVGDADVVDDVTAVLAVGGTASAMASVLPGFLHSTRASGMPFTNSTSSGTMHFLPPCALCAPGMSTRNCETTTKSLLGGLSQSM
jgi:hypothetical protein